MNRIRQYGGICLGAAALLGLVCLPGVGMERQTARLLRQSAAYSVEVTQLLRDEDTEQIEHARNIWTRAGMIQSSSVMMQTAGYTDLSDNGALFQKMEKQLASLEGFGVLPSFLRTEPGSISYTRCSYLDSEKPEFEVSVWVIQVKYGDVLVCVHMDVETDAVYNVLVAVEGTETLLYGKDDPQQGYRAYLATFGEPEQEDESVPVYYLGKKDRMYVGVMGMYQISDVRVYVP